MYVINPDPYLTPTYRISPFTTKDISLNNKLKNDNFIDKYFNNRFNKRKFFYTQNARQAIFTALKYYNLKKEDTVTIFTTSNNLYISSCVTDQIEQFCKWSRKIEYTTKVIFINHEFGYPYSDLKFIKKFGFPIIEDCAYSFFSQDENNLISTVGDFVIYSFPKMFPVQFGGLLVINIPKKISVSNFLDNESERYLKNVLSFYIRNGKEIVDKRISNYNILAHEFKNFGFFERFELKNGIAPGVFMFRKNNLRINLNNLKKYFFEHGVQCSVFYGEESFFIPVHQALNDDDIGYFVEIIRKFIVMS